MNQATDEILHILDNIVNKLNQPDCDVFWSYYNNQTEALADIECHIARLKKGKVSNLQDLKLLFAPTGSLQEIAISSGWGDEFLTLATQVDIAIADLVN